MSRFTGLCDIPSQKKTLYFTVTYNCHGIERLDFGCPSPFERQRGKSPRWIQELKGLLNEYFKGQRVPFRNIPLNMQKASRFHQKVWRQAQKIPFGKTVSYETLACASGSPRASRAVGSAMKANPFPILVPCHRVIRKNGGLGGYSKGLAVKKMLLALEKTVL